jgi:excisionase family DNA binding protein
MSSASFSSLPKELYTVIGEAIRQGIENALCEAYPRQPSQSSPRPEFYSIREAMNVLALSRSEFYRRVKSRELTIVKRGRRSLVSVSEVSAYAERLRRAAAEISR